MSRPAFVYGQCVRGGGGKANKGRNRWLVLSVLRSAEGHLRPECPVSPHFCFVKRIQTHDLNFFLCCITCWKVDTPQRQCDLNAGEKITESMIMIRFRHNS